MPTRGQTFYFRQNVNSFLALLFVGSFSLGVGLIVWHAAVGNNPIADFLAQTDVLRAALQ